MPLSAEWTVVGFAASRHAHEHGCIKRVALRAIAALSGAHPLPFFSRRFLHEELAPSPAVVANTVGEDSMVNSFEGDYLGR